MQGQDRPARHAAVAEGHGRRRLRHLALRQVGELAARSATRPSRRTSPSTAACRPRRAERADHAITFLKGHDGAKPFFMYLAPPRAARPAGRAAEQFAKMYDPAKLTLSKNFMPRHPFDNGELAVRDETLAPIPRTEDGHAQAPGRLLRDDQQPRPRARPRPRGAQSRGADGQHGRHLSRATRAWRSAAGTA